MGGTKLQMPGVHAAHPTLVGEAASLSGAESHAADAGGSPVAVVFECADCPIPAASMFDHPPGALFSVRTWGHALDRAVLGSIEFVVSSFDIPLVVVLGHRDCTALNASERVDPAGNGTDDATPEAAHASAICAALVQTSPILADRVAEGRCAVIGVVAGSDGRVDLHSAFGDVGAWASMPDDERP